jgi:signal transduction histidine kinase
MLAIVKSHSGKIKLLDAPTGGLRIEITLPKEVKIAQQN